jgi:hypothetical protein
LLGGSADVEQQGNPALDTELNRLSKKISITQANLKKTNVLIELLVAAHKELNATRSELISVTGDLSAALECLGLDSVGEMCTQIRALPWLHALLASCSQKLVTHSGPSILVYPRPSLTMEVVGAMQHMTVKKARPAPAVDFLQTASLILCAVRTTIAIPALFVTAEFARVRLNQQSVRTTSLTHFSEQASADRKVVVGTHFSFPKHGRILIGAVKSVVKQIVV